MSKNRRTIKSNNCKFSKNTTDVFRNKASYLSTRQLVTKMDEDRSDFKILTCRRVNLWVMFGERNLTRS